MRLLLQHKANPSAQNKAGKTALDLAKNDDIRASITIALASALDSTDASTAAEAKEMVKSTATLSPSTHKQGRKRPFVSGPGSEVDAAPKQGVLTIDDNISDSFVPSNPAKNVKVTLQHFEGIDDDSA